jgi:hypothetical protein
MSSFKTILFDAPTKSLEEFEDLVIKAKEAGVTHINISRLSRRTEYVDKGINERNPWTEWSIMVSSVFKHHQPSELEGVYDEGFVQEQISLLKKKHEIVDKYGLKSFYAGNEPLWLPNKVYVKFPHWRGARGDNSLRTRDLLYAPCIDQPEVLELYRRAVYEIVKAAPSIDIFAFSTDDSGAAICWTQRLYAGMNGPTWCAGKDIGERVKGFLKTLRQGAIDAGVDARVYLLGGLSKSETLSVISRLEPGIGVGFNPSIIATIPEKLKECFIGFAEWTPWETAVNKLPHPFLFLSGLSTAYKSGCETIYIGFCFSPADPTIFTALRILRETKLDYLDSLEGKVNFVKKIAETEFTQEIASQVMEAWYEMEVARHLNDSLGPAFKVVTYMGPLANRWLVRPILGTQHKLTEDELAYCKQWIYQIKPDGYKDYLKVCHIRYFESWTHARDIASVIESAKAHLLRAAVLFRKAKEKVSNLQLKEKLELNALRAEAQHCFLTNISNTIQIAAISYEREKYADSCREETDPNILAFSDSDQIPWDLGSMQLQVIYRLQRSELDNTNELIGILQKSSEPLIVSVSDKSQEGFYKYGPDLIDQLRNKVELMLRHWRDVDELYFRPIRGT